MIGILTKLPNALTECPTNTTLVSALQRPLSTLILVLQQPPSLILPYNHHTMTLVTDLTITALAAINPVCHVTIPTAKTLASYVITSVTTILASYVTIYIATITTGAQLHLLP
jgi:hypothetical protein